ncbi:MAG: hypothetical protein QNJ44_24215 [Rhodobacter sp.]|nr:hypothetical protein [Rhodobacter sp.]
MEKNATPFYDASVDTTGCCPKFNTEGWDDQVLHFEDKPFVRAETRAAMHVPLNMGSVFSRVFKHILDQGAVDVSHSLVLSQDLSPWKGEHLFAVDKPVEGEEMTKLSGDFLTKVFEGPYRDAKGWYGEMKEAVTARGKTPGRIYFFYTTCPKCAKVYGKNYVVGVAEML